MAAEASRAPMAVREQLIVSKSPSRDRRQWDVVQAAERTTYTALQAAKGTKAVDAAADEHTSALSALIATPAPDESALRAKLDAMFGNDDNDTWNNELMEGLRADWRRVLPVRPPQRNPSAIMAMHTRYERAQAEYSAVERAEGEAIRANGRDSLEVTQLEDATSSLSRELDALRIAILHQVPDSWPEAMVLQFHAMTLLDMHTNCDGEPPEPEVHALQTAIDTVFDFMCCEVDQDHGEIGASFQSGANRAFFMRRRRTGVVED